MAFLTARWSNLAILTYAVPPAHLQSYIPPGCELDLLEGRAFVSLVAFDFLRTRVLGIPWPGYRDFPEINLRFYMRHSGQRGVCFIREFVPRRLVTAMARWLYNEPYRAAKMFSQAREDADSIHIEHELLHRGSRYRLRLSASKPAMRPDESSIEHFFKEHRWGFGVSRKGRLLRYEVIHPVWEIYPAREHELVWDWAEVYGPQWGFLRDERPFSVMLARGSEVSVGHAR